MQNEYPYHPSGGWHRPRPNAAEHANSIIDLRKQPARTPKQAEPAKPDCCGQPPVPARQKNAREYLAGRSPGVMQSYAPNAAASPVEGWVEDDETVHRLAHWREEAIY